MYIQTEGEIVTHVSVEGEVTQGAPATAIYPAEGMTVDIQAVYEIAHDGTVSKENIVGDLTSLQIEQLDERMIDQYENLERFE